MDIHDPRDSTSLTVRLLIAFAILHIIGLIIIAHT